MKAKWRKESNQEMRMCILLPRGGWHPRGPLNSCLSPSRGDTTSAPGTSSPRRREAGGWPSSWQPVFSDSNTFSIHWRVLAEHLRRPSQCQPHPFHPKASWLPAPSEAPPGTSPVITGASPISPPAQLYPPTSHGCSYPWAPLGNQASPQKE